MQNWVAGVSRQLPDWIRSTGKRIARFGIVGVGVNAALYVLYLLATRLPIAPEIVTSASYVLAVLCLYVLNRAWAFSDRTPAPGAPARFVVVYGVAYLFSIGLFALLYRLVGWPHEIVQLATILCTALVTFALLNFWAFRNPAGSEMTQPGDRRRAEQKGLMSQFCDQSEGAAQSKTRLRRPPPSARQPPQSP